MKGIPRIRECLEQIYGPGRAPDLMTRIEALLAKWRPRLPSVPLRQLDQRDAILITYPDQVRSMTTAPLVALKELVDHYLRDVVSSIHLLPFYPSSGDDGFAVMDYREVDPAYGTWDDVLKLGENFDLMFDAVINHVSTSGKWFQEFLRGVAPFDEYFIIVRNSPDVSTVVRPRTSPLLTVFQAARGPVSVWTTFSADQADLDFHTPEVLLEVLDVLLFYATKGARFIRLDAIAYLWKELGTDCLSRPQVHWMVRLFRAILEEMGAGVRLVTETNVGYIDNLSYLGDGGNEADLVYNFSLPPLLLHAIRSGEATPLADWVRSLRMPSGTPGFLNILATHDGIGLNGARGILSDDEIDRLISPMEAAGCLISRRSLPDGASSPYEINANFLDALEAVGPKVSCDLSIARFLTAHAVMLALKGVPAIYFHSLFGSRGWPEGVEKTGRPRSVNREKIRLEDVEREMHTAGSLRPLIFTGFSHLLAARRSHPAFSPSAYQRVLESAPGILALERWDSQGGERVLCLHNLTEVIQTFACAEFMPTRLRNYAANDLLSGRQIAWGQDRLVGLEPYQTIWIVAPGDGR